MIELAGQQVFGGVLLRGDDGSGWMTLLVFAVVIVLNAVAGLIRARKRKADLQQQQPAAGPRRPAKPPRRQPASRPVQQVPAPQPIRPQPAAAPRREAPTRPKPRTIVRPGSALEAFVSEIKAEIMGGIKQARERKTPAKPPPQTDKTKAKAGPVRHAAATPSSLRGAKPAAADALSGIMPDFSGPDDLSRAIVYHEVLGKPVSLRQPGDYLIGL